MITEDYISFETAKLLKEKGFDGVCRTAYETITKEHEVEQCSHSSWGKLNQVKRPTLQMAMKWLRETHNINISVDPHSHKEDKTFDYEFVYWNGGEYHMPYDEKRPTYHELFGKTWEKYEEACETAIKYCLENLI